MSFYYPDFCYSVFTLILCGLRALYERVDKLTSYLWERVKSKKNNLLLCLLLSVLMSFWLKRHRKVNLLLCLLLSDLMSFCLISHRKVKLLLCLLLSDFMSFWLISHRKVKLLLCFLSSDLMSFWLISHRKVKLLLCLFLSCLQHHSCGALTQDVRGVNTKETRQH